VYPQIFGKYVLEREIAAGGMARVYLATLRGAVGFEKRLVVKQIRPELASDEAFVRRFVGEAKTAVELSHPNIVPVYELGVEQGVYYIAMELCLGVTLSEVLAATGKLSPVEGAYLGVEICRALDYAHRRAGIVHRDVTPRNVLIDDEGAVRLIDFGIAAPVAAGDDDNEVFGSPGHMPPEQLAGKPLTPAADVFAVAVLLVEAWTGTAPFRRATARESRRALLEERPPPLSAARPELEPLDALIARSLSLDASERPAEAEALARPLRDFLRSADTGDIARRLAERVRRVRSTERRKEPSSRSASSASGAESAPRSSRSSVPTALTQTFAVRDEVVEWTRRISEPPPASSSAPHTRKLASLPPARSEADAATRDAEGRREPVARSEIAPSEAALALPEPSSTKRPVQRRTLMAFVAGAGAALVALVPVLVPARASGPDAVTPRDPVSAASAPRAAETASRLPAPREAPEPVASAFPEPSSSVAVAASATPSSAPRPASPRPAAVQRPAVVANAALRLTADPGARVRVLGRGFERALTTPVRELRLPAGAYTITFENVTYAAPVRAEVIVEEGARRSVHADFREAEPRVSVR